MYVGLKQPLGDGERCVTPARAAAKETILSLDPAVFLLLPGSKIYYGHSRYELKWCKF